LSRQPAFDAIDHHDENPMRQRGRGAGCGADAHSPSMANARRDADLVVV